MEQKQEGKPRSDTGDKAEKLKKPLGVGQLLQQKVTLFDLSNVNPDLYQAFGNVPPRGVWFAWGGSGSGKSSLLLDLAKAFASEMKVLHDELEEETDDFDFIERLKLKEMSDVSGKYIAASYDYDQLTTYLSRRDSPECVIINSAGYFFPNLEAYFRFTKKFKRKKLIIISGMADGKKPYSELEKRIMYDANKKIFVDGYLATCKGRTIGPNGGTYIIWHEGYEKIHGVQEKNNPDE